MRMVQQIPGVTVQIAAVSPFVIGLLSGAGVCPASEIALLPNLVSAEYLDAGRRNLLGRVELAKAPSRVLYVGTGSYRKGFDVGIKMLTGIADEYSIATVQIAGFDPYRSLSLGDGRDGAVVVAGLRDLAARTDVQLLGRKDDLLEDYLAADIMVVPSRMESFGRVALEGAAAGVPLVCSSNPGHMAFLAADSAFIFTAGDAVSGLEALRRAVGDHEERRRRSERALIAAERYGWQVWSDAIASVFDPPSSFVR